MTAVTYTGRLINEDAQVSIEGGPILAVRGSPNPIATAAGQYAVWGQTQPVTVTGVPDTVDNIPVLFVTSIQWAAQAPAAAAVDDFSQGGVTSLDDAVASVAAKPVTVNPVPPKIQTARKSARKRT
jgi:hypothetical protein